MARVLADRMRGVMYRTVCVVIAFTLIASASSIRAQPPEDQYCAVLREIVGHTKNDFASFKAKATARNNEWTPLRVLPDQQQCVVRQTPKTISYACESAKLPQQNLAAAL